MSRKDITKHLSALLEKHLNPSNDTRIYISKEVSFNCYGGEQTIRVDYMRFKPVNNYTAEGIENGKFYCYEIKSSVEDFHSPNGHNFIGDYNYYVMPEEVFEKVKDEIHSNVGVFVPYCGEYYTWLRSVKNAKKQQKRFTTYEMLLMMFRSANRETMKKKNQDSQH